MYARLEVYKEAQKRQRHTGNIGYRIGTAVTAERAPYGADSEYARSMAPCRGGLATQAEGVEEDTKVKNDHWSLYLNVAEERRERQRDIVPHRAAHAGRRARRGRYGGSFIVTL